ncbi:glutamate racemase [Kurthia sibirica]|uniref:Glutamate racemase n=1 Tax=Kurthia sibirica TaxID=202750 RepID=A0A2U3ANP8_9BACL|nr:glutamate racemase [Kurthia sibirica]PWI26129.1 glutamate racemase [Kurthia sibirica]GEK33386.1 glutamate racemase [Kurthia sibirica]
MNAPIGVIDSGVGGLTVVKEMLKYLPNETIYYIGDTARCPYGPRTGEQVLDFTTELAEKLKSMHIKMLVIACNTATAVALEPLQKQCDFPVIGVINAGATAAIKETKSHEIAVIATAGTVKSGAYEDALYSLYSQSVITSLACPALVPLVESGQSTGTFAQQLVEKTLAPLQEATYDTMILGCTHYPIIQELIEHVVGPKVHVVSSATETAKHAKEILEFMSIDNTSGIRGKHQFFATGSVPKFQTVLDHWLKLDDTQAQKIDL